MVSRSTVTIAIAIAVDERAGNINIEWVNQRPSFLPKVTIP
jgi:hypothetical protein